MSDVLISNLEIFNAILRKAGLKPLSMGDARDYDLGLPDVTEDEIEEWARDYVSEVQTEEADFKRSKKDGDYYNY